MKSISRTARAIAVIAAISAVGISLTGCSASGTSASNTLTVQYSSDANGRYRVDHWVTLFKAKYPNVTVKLQPVTNTADQGTNLQVLTSNSAPDIGVLPLESSVYSKMSQGKQLVPLTDLYASSNLQSRIGASATAAGKYGGVSYVVPYDSSLYNAVYYNKALFKQLGIAEPANHRFSSVDELNKAVAALKAAGKQGIGIGVADNYQASWLIDATLPNVSSDSQYENYLTNWQTGVAQTAKYTDPQFVDSLSRVKDMASAGLFQSGYLGASVPSAQALFEQGKTGLILGGSWFANTFATDKISFDYDWALLPAIDTSKNMVLNSYLGDSYGIPVNAKNPALAKKFLAVVRSVEGQAVNLGVGDLPMVNDVAQSKYSALPAAVQSMVADVAKNGSAVGWSNVVPPTVGANAIEPVEQEMLNGNGSPQSVAAGTEAALQKLRK
jgi:raffinose/stachyose/melibiose transport system substrate-binding protein